MDGAFAFAKGPNVSFLTGTFLQNVFLKFSFL